MNETGSSVVSDISNFMVSASLCVVTKIIVIFSCDGDERKYNLTNEFDIKSKPFLLARVAAEGKYVVKSISFFPRRGREKIRPTAALSSLGAH